MNWMSPIVYIESPISDIEIKINDILVVVINVYIPPTSSFSSGSFSWNSRNRFRK